MLNGLEVLTAFFCYALKIPMHVLEPQLHKHTHIHTHTHTHTHTHMHTHTPNTHSLYNNPVHLVQESLHLILLLFSKSEKKCKWWSDFVIVIFFQK